MSIPAELSRIITEKLADSGDTNVRQRASRQIKAYLSVLKQRLDISKKSENYTRRDDDVIQSLMFLNALQCKEASGHTK